MNKQSVRLQQWRAGKVGGVMKCAPRCVGILGISCPLWELALKEAETLSLLIMDKCQNSSQARHPWTAAHVRCPLPVEEAPAAWQDVCPGGWQQGVGAVLSHRKVNRKEITSPLPLTHTRKHTLSIFYSVFYLVELFSTSPFPSPHFLPPVPGGIPIVHKQGDIKQMNGLQMPSLNWV